MQFSQFGPVKQRHIHGNCQKHHLAGVLDLGGRSENTTISMVECVASMDLQECQSK